MPWVFLALSLVGAWFTFNAYRPIYRPAGLATLSFFAGWLTNELALHHLAWQGALALLLARAGGLQGWPGLLGLGITIVSWAFLARVVVIAVRSEQVVEEALRRG